MTSSEQHLDPRDANPRYLIQNVGDLKPDLTPVGTRKTDYANSSDQNSSGVTEPQISGGKFSLRQSFAPILRGNFGRPGEPETAYRNNVLKFRRCCGTMITIILVLSITFIIVLWVVALIIAGPDETHSCVILWPIIAGVLILGASFAILRIGEWCIKKRRKKLRKKAPFGNHKSSLEARPTTTTGPPTSSGRSSGASSSGLVPYVRNSKFYVCYIVLAFLLFVIMIASVVQYFTLDPVCKQHLADHVEELLLGYEILAYISLVVLSILACCMTCFLFGTCVYILGI